MPQSRNEVVAEGGGRAEVVQHFGHPQVGVGIEAFGKFVALIAQVGFDFEFHAVAVAYAVVQAAAEFPAQAFFGQVGDVPHHAGDAQPAARDGVEAAVVAFVEVGVGDDGLAGNVVEGDVLRRQAGGGGNHQRVPHAVGVVYRPLQCLHAAQAAADDGRPLADAEAVGQQSLAVDPVFYGNDGEVRAVFLSVFGVGAQRAGAAGTAAQVVEPDNEEAVGVHGFAGADHAVPPAGVFVVGVVAAGNVVVAGEGVADQYGVGFVGVECAVGFHHQIEARQGLAVLQDKRLFERDFFGRYQPYAVGGGHNVCAGEGKGRIITAFVFAWLFQTAFLAGCMFLFY